MNKLDELNLILAFIKKCKGKNNKRSEYNPEYIKSIERVLHSTFGNLHEYVQLFAIDIPKIFTNSFFKY